MQSLYLKVDMVKYKATSITVSFSYSLRCV